MSTYTKQSKQPKPQKPQDIIDRFKRDMSEAGFDVEAVYQIGSPYSPSITLDIWPSKKEESVGKQT